MAYSSTGQFRINVPRITTNEHSDVALANNIVLADLNITVDLSKIVDFTLVTNTPAGCPNYINLLSQYKTCEMVLVAKYSAKRMDVEQTDYMYWQKMYNDLLTKLLAGEIDLGTPGLSTGTFEASARDRIEPALGQGKNGEWVDDDELESIRSEYGAQED